MRRAWVLLGIVAVLLLPACGDGDTNGVGDPDAKIDDVDVMLARICEAAAQCPGISATQPELDACPGGIRAELSSSQLAQLERFLGYTKSRQDCILQCVGGRICDRFGGSVSNISDSDAVEPVVACELQCP